MSRLGIASSLAAAVALGMSASAAFKGGGLSNRAGEDIARRRRARAAPPAPEPVEGNLPGETNRQFAARMKATGGA